ncbi:LIM domain-containing protein PLIM2b-like isoform X2 [Salvia miltiorrhiza]|uniref:LIM domain-containing protein PLIM2b-like isoform X2 n=1 Tax=Salvia miltiorrhiza TaxID=226208 RepID=UPI0025AD716A|nr:LIM domain-containing protein PLIM2b-like isoform X2 [Salvia miltiorrhiza]
MASTFTGTLDKCKACDKTVYFVDLLSADGATYHKSCFKCSHCKGTLVMSNYSSMDGVLYCKTHFEQLFKESGNFSKNFQTGKGERENSLTRAPSKLSAMFSGTQDKCAACSKTVYPLEKMNMEGEPYHKSCFKCAHGGCPLTHSNYAALDGVLYCKHHFQQLFMEKGNYQHVLDAASHKKSASMEAVDVDALAEDAAAAGDEHAEPAAEAAADAAEDEPAKEEEKAADDDDADKTQEQS